MPVETTVEPGLVRFEMRGDFEFRDYLNAVAAARADPATPRDFQTLIVDLGTPFNPDMDEVRDVAEGLLANTPTTRSRVALVVTREVHFGLGRMMETFAGPEVVRLRVFRDEAEARAWLAGADDPA